jgi:ornithine carbamoyltransferase
MSEPRHFLDLDRVDGTDLRAIVDRARELKKAPKQAAGVLSGKTLAMIFEKPSTRTRVSFEVAMKRLGGNVVVMDGNSSQLGRGETVADTARVLSRYVDAILLRANAKADLEELAAHASVPVINGLTDASHPCQIMADIQTYEEHRGSIGGRRIAWVGDGNNVAASWLHAAARFSFGFRIATPPDLRLPAPLVDWAKNEGADVSETDNAAEAVADADCVVTDTWVSMGDDAERERRLSLLTPYRVDETLMAKAKPDAVFMHCLPAHRGEEVTAGVIDGPQSVVWDEAENRLHAQMAILAWCFGAI